MVHEELNAILDNVNDWLKFAEAKNGLLVAFNCGVVLAITDKVEDLSGPPRAFAYTSIVLLCIAILIGLMSLVPRLSSAMSPRPGRKQRPNLLFFADLASLTQDELLSIVEERSGKPLSGMESDWANQIIVNSEIALAKYRLFVAAISATLLAALIPLLLWFVFVIC